MDEQIITLTDVEREALGLIVARADNQDQSLSEWHPCETCPGGPCPCSGRPWLGAEMAEAIERILATRVAAARADERARVLGEVEARANQMDAGKPGVIGWFPDPTADAFRRILRDLREQGGGR